MGVRSWDFIQYHRHNLDEIAPRVIAIDAPNYLIRRMQAFEYRGKGSSERIPISHIYITISIIRSFLQANFIPLFIFDGPPESLKRPSNPQLLSFASEVYNQYKDAENVYDTKLAHMLWESRPLRWYFAVLHIKELCRRVGVPSFTAPSEAEMLAAAICNKGLCGTVLTNDVDALLFGSPRVSRSIKMSAGWIESATIAQILKETGVGLPVLRDLAIVSGCDFSEGIKGIGPRRGLTLLKRFGGIIGLLKSRGFGPNEREEFLRAREVFDEADSMKLTGVHTKLNAPLNSQVISFLAPLMGTEKAEKQALELLRLWKEFGNIQASLEEWV